MPSRKPPAYQHHRSSGHARVKLRGKTIWLGRYGSEESLKRYQEVVAEWQAGRSPAVQRPQLADVTLAVVIAGYLKHAHNYYTRNGKLSSEYANVRRACLNAARVYGHLPMSEFGPTRLKTLQAEWAAVGYVRITVNQDVRRVVRVVRAGRWAVSDELVEPGVLEALRSVEGLRKGRSVGDGITPKESTPVRPVTYRQLAATLRHVTSVVASLLRFAHYSGCRPTEACLVRPGDIDRTAAVWIYRPGSFKTEWRENAAQREIYVGPRAQRILTPYLDRDEDSYCFDPAESERQAAARRRSERQTPLYPSHVARYERQKASKKPRKFRKHFTYDVVNKAISRACETAGVDNWTCNQLRHLAGTRVRQAAGLEASQAVLGHAHADVTQIYAERDRRLAAKVVGEIG